MRSLRLALVALMFAAATAAATATAAPGGARVQAARGVVVIRTALGYQETAAAGTGIVIGSGGVVLTNNHVIRGATAIRVSVPGGRVYTARVLGYAIGDDVAVLKLADAAGLATVRLGSSATVRRGQAVTAIGNAGGSGTLVSSAGTVVALGRSITVQDDQGGTARLRGLIQTDAELQPGDSGGPLLDGAGRVVGIDTAASARFAFQAGTSEGFAIPIDHALTIARQIRAGRASATVHVGPTAFLGVSVQSADSVGFGTGGALVGQVVAGGPADRAGLVTGDVITAIAGRTVASPASVVPILQARKPGDTIRISWVDTLGNRASGTARLAAGPPQ